MIHIILDLHDDWMRLDTGIEAISGEITEIGQREAPFRALRTIAEAI